MQGELLLGIQYHLNDLATYVYDIYTYIFTYTNLVFDALFQWSSSSRLRYIKLNLAIS